MENITFKRNVFLILFMLLCSVTSVYADNDGLITQQITINITEPGTLSKRISESKKNLITNLKLKGTINIDDILYIRELAGCYTGLSGAISPGNLHSLDISETKLESNFSGDFRYFYFPDRAGEILYAGYKSHYYYSSGYCFAGLTKLENINLGYASDIGESMFRGCKNLVSVELKGYIHKVDNYAFEGCTSLKIFPFDVVYEDFGYHAFGECTSLTSVSFPKEMRKIGGFNGCTNLTTIVFPDSLETIYADAFADCTGLKSLIFPNGLERISSCAFKGCKNIKSIYLPSKLTSIGYEAFSGCTGVKAIYAFMEMPAATDDKTFSEIDKKSCTLYIPQNTYMDYFLAKGWDEFENIVEFDPTGIDAVPTNNGAKEVSRYTVDGQQLSVPTKGLNIVKYSDGTTRKVMVP